MPNVSVPAAAPGLPFARRTSLRHSTANRLSPYRAAENKAPHDGAQIRKLIADHIERLIAVLDTLNGEPDFEPDACRETFLQAELPGRRQCPRY